MGRRAGGSGGKGPIIWKAGVAYDLSTGAALGGGAIANQELLLRTANGYGSTNTVIRRWTTAEVNSITASATYADSAGDGMSVTIITAGLYAISYTDQFNTSATLGVSVNSTQLTTNITSITDTHNVGASRSVAGNSPGSMSVVLLLSASDVVRTHNSGAISGTETTCEMFRMVRMG